VVRQLLPRWGGHTLEIWRSHPPCSAHRLLSLGRSPLLWAPALRFAPILCCIGQPELCREWGTPPESPPFPSRLISFPSRLLSKHNTLYENHSFAVYTLALLGTTISVSLSRAPPHPPSEDQRTGFSIGIRPVVGRSQAYTPARWKRFGRGFLCL
jgi:hypothetical protein